MLAFIVASAGFGCSGDEPVHSYHVRGVVEEVTGKGADARVAIHHEAIDDFKDRDGKAAKMASMVMMFGFADSVPVSTFVPGEKAEFTFDVRFSKTPPLLITHVEKLPADTQLTLSAAE